MSGSFFICYTCKDFIRDGVCVTYEKDGVLIAPIMQGDKIWGRHDFGRGGWVDPSYCMKCTKKELKEKRRKEKKDV